MLDRKELLKMIDFGEIDGLYDNKLEKYFLDDNYWDRIVDSKIFFVIGRKGTGKSAIYNWIEKQALIRGALISNLSFKEFPFDKLLKLSDDDFSRPNQYQSIWRNIILSEYASLIVKDVNAVDNDEFFELVDYVNYYFGDDLIELHKQITKIAEKRSRGLFIKCLKFGNEDSIDKSYANEFENITKLNRRLEELIISYLKDCFDDKLYIIQFDQLDDNYTQLQKYTEYNQCIISLFKTIYDINQKFRSQNIRSKTIAYLRSDIFYSIDTFDSESARWDGNKLNLNWSIVNKDDWNNPGLLKVLNKRISSSISDILEDNAFHEVFDKNYLNMNEQPFKYIIHRSFHRPRDIIQFSIKIQNEAIDTNRFYFRTIYNAEKEYSLWLLSEIANEIAVKIPNLDALYEYLRLLGQNAFNLSDFKYRYKNFESRIGLDSEYLLKYLYSLGIIHNVIYTNNNTEYYSIIRNDRSTFNRDLKIQIHFGFWKGLHTSKFSTKAKI